MSTSLLLIAFVAASLLGAGVMIWAYRNATASFETLQAMAGPRGWVVTEEEDASRYGSTTVISDPGESWQMRIYFRSGGVASSSNKRYTAFVDRTAAQPDGLTVLGPALPAKTMAKAERLLEMPFMKNALFSGLAEITGRSDNTLSVVEGRASDRDGLLLSSPGAEDGLDPIFGLPELISSRRGNPAQHPTIIRGEFGLHMRVNGTLRKPDQITAFIALGQQISRKLQT